MQKLAPGVYIETGFRGVTVGAVVTPDGLICIDSPTLPADARKWRLRLAQASQKPIRFVINTDHNRDRVLGNQWFEAPVIAHVATAERIRAYPEIFKAGQPEGGGDYETASGLAGVRIFPPSLAFSQELILLKGGREVRLMHAPGSAPGAAWVHIPDADVLFVGDSVVVGAFPILADADLDQWIDSLSRLRRARFPAKIIVAGRGGVTNKAGVKPTLDYIRLVRRRVKALIRSGGQRADVANLVPSLMGCFPSPDGQRDQIARRLRAGLEHVYDEIAGVPPEC